MGMQELAFGLVVILVLFGGSQLPKLARNLGKAQKEFKDGVAEGEREALSQRSPTATATPVTPAETPAPGTVTPPSQDH